MTSSFWITVIATGLAAAVLSGLTLMTLALVKDRSPVAPFNATSQWIIGPRAAAVSDVRLAETGVGLGTHVASAVLWGGVMVVAVRMTGITGTGATILLGLGVAALALILDYGLLPRQISPGWHLVLRWWAVVVGFVALGLGLGLGAAGSVGAG